jgi:pentose-5-phosphate-3-epimerase
MKTTEELAREAGLVSNHTAEEYHSDLMDGVWISDLKRFRDLVRNEALEEAAEVADGGLRMMLEDAFEIPCSIRALKKDLQSSK